MWKILSTELHNRTGLKGPLFRWFIILILVHLIFVGKFSCFVIEPSDSDGEQYLPEIFAFGMFSFPETKAVVSNEGYSIYEVMRVCAGDDNAKYAMEKLSSVIGLSLNETASITPQITAAEELSHVFNGCTPGLSSALKEIITHVSLALWPWNIYAIKNYAYQLEWYGRISIANNLYDDCIYLLNDERGCALHRMFVAPPLLWSEQQAHRIYTEAIFKTKNILRKDYKKHISKDDPQSIHQSLTLDPQYNVRELQMHSQYLGKHPGLLSQAYALSVCHLYPSLGVSLVSLVDPRNSRWKDRKAEEVIEVVGEVIAENVVEKMEEIIVEDVREKTIKTGEESYINIQENDVREETIAIKEEKSLNKQDNVVGGGKGNDKESRGSRTIRLGVISEHEGNSSPGICLMKVLQLLVDNSGNDENNRDSNSGSNNDSNIDGKNSDANEIDGNYSGDKDENNRNKSNNRNNNNIKIELIFFDRPNPRSIFSYLLTQVASKVITISHLDLSGSRQLIADEKVDVLLYMALPTEKFTTFLSMSRLAPIQIQFGIGHPVSSGSLAIDYSVVSELMIPEYRDLTSYEGDSTFNTASEELSQYKGDRGMRGDSGMHDKPDGQSKEMIDRVVKSQDHPTPSSPLSSPLHYTEQLVLFSSLGHYLDDPLLLYPPESPPEGVDTSSFATSFSASKSSLYSSTMSSTVSSTLSTFSSNSVSTVEVEVNSHGVVKIANEIEETEENKELNKVINKVEKETGKDVQNEVQKVFHPLDFAFNSSCESINMFLSRIGIHQVTAEMLGDCYIDGGVSDDVNESVNESVDGDVGVEDVGDGNSTGNIDNNNNDNNGDGNNGNIDNHIDNDRNRSHGNSNGIGGTHSDNNDRSKDSSKNNETHTARTHTSRTYIPRGLHLYGCMQMPKKMHPSFDPVLKGILTQDPRGVILMLARGEDLIPRWAGTVIDNKFFPGTLNMTEKQIKSRIIFIPRLSHPDYLKLTSLASVFLNTFPYGAGITSSEALALCVPLVTLPSRITVLQMTLAQIRTYGHDITEKLIAKNVPDYIAKVVQITIGRDVQNSCAQNAQSSVNDNSEENKNDPLDPGNMSKIDEIKEVKEVEGRGLKGESDSIESIEGIGESPLSPLVYDMRRTLCDRRAGLFGQHQLEVAAEEWRTFLMNIT